VPPHVTPPPNATAGVKSSALKGTAKQITPPSLARRKMAATSTTRPAPSALRVSSEQGGGTLQGGGEASTLGRRWPLTASTSKSVSGWGGRYAAEDAAGIDQRREGLRVRKRSEGKARRASDYRRSGGKSSLRFASSLRQRRGATRAATRSRPQTDRRCPKAFKTYPPPPPPQRAGQRRLCSVA
jgi:hypothetical protein